MAFTDLFESAHVLARGSVRAVQDAQGWVTLENEWVRIRFNPDQGVWPGWGGGIRSWLFKPANVDMVGFRPLGFDAKRHNISILRGLRGADYRVLKGGRIGNLVIGGKYQDHRIVRTLDGLHTAHRHSRTRISGNRFEQNVRFDRDFA